MDQPSVLFQNRTKTVVLLDVPRTVEESQVPSQEPKPGEQVRPRRLISAPPPLKPFPTPEPKSGGLQNASTPRALVTELMAQAAVLAALDELRSAHRGPWLLPRIVEGGETEATSTEEPKSRHSEPGQVRDQPLGDDFIIPPSSNYLLGTIQERRAEFVAKAPKFDLMVLDPPWPSRSVRRKKGSYTTAPDSRSVRELLSLIPVALKLSPSGIVAIWVTNRPALTALLTSPKGVFYEWGVELVSSWTWLKVAASGDPIFDVGSRWRKPWEQLLIARRPGSQRELSSDSKVIVAVPDAHSRKPNLRPLFDEILPPGYAALEIFARNLTAGWWSWGDDVLCFQRRRHWATNTDGAYADSVSLTESDGISTQVAL